CVSLVHSLWVLTTSQSSLYFLILLRRRPPSATLFPYTTLFRSRQDRPHARLAAAARCLRGKLPLPARAEPRRARTRGGTRLPGWDARNQQPVSAHEAPPPVLPLPRWEDTGRVGL